MVFNEDFPVGRRKPANPPLKQQLYLLSTGRFFRTSITQDALNLTILLKQISITLSRAITITGKGTYIRRSNLSYFRWESEIWNVSTGVAFRAEAPLKVAHT